MSENEPMIMALPKGRILKEVMPIIRAAGIVPEDDFDNSGSRKLTFDTNIPNLKIYSSYFSALYSCLMNHFLLLGIQEDVWKLKLKHFIERHKGLSL